jgi:hypothetical protein
MFIQLIIGVQTKQLNLFWLKIFSIYHQCQQSCCTFSGKYLFELSKKFVADLVGYLGAYEKLIHKKT